MTQPDKQHVDTQLEQQLQSVLRSSEHRLPQTVEQQLSRARQTALAEQAPRSPFFAWPKLAVAAATIAVVAVLMVPMFNGSSLNEPTDEQVLALDDELYQELEFYQWLVETDAMDGHNG